MLAINFMRINYIKLINLPIITTIKPVITLVSFKNIHFHTDECNAGVSKTHVNI